MPQYSVVKGDPISELSGNLTQDLLGNIFRAFCHQKGSSITRPLGEVDIEYDLEDNGFPDETPSDFGKNIPWKQSNSTAADGLNPAQLLSRYQSGVDPFTDVPDGSGRNWYAKLPLTKMMIAVRFLEFIKKPDMLLTLTAPQAITFIQMPNAAERMRIAETLPALFDDLAQVCDPIGQMFRGVEITALPDLSGSQRETYRKEFATKIEWSIGAGRTLLVLAPTFEDLPTNAQVICGTPCDFPPITTTMVIEVLRHTHSATGRLSDTEIRNRLPSDAEIQSLPYALLQNAFFTKTTLNVADSLSSKIKALQSRETPNTLTLSRVHLPDEIRADMEQLLSDLTLCKAGQLDWAHVASSFLLVGDPGTGKTLLAQAFAGSAVIPFFSVSYADCQKAGHQGDFLRVLAENVEKAVKEAPAVVFFDEIDSYSHRKQTGRNSSYIIAIVNALLEHLTRINGVPGLVIFGATNLPENIDPAIIRHGRFDTHITLTNPDRAGIKRILEIELRNDASRLQLDHCADRLLGLSGAQVAAVVRDARGKSRRDGGTLLDVHLKAALDRIAPSIQTDIMRRISVHEAGHAITAYVLGLPLPDALRLTVQGGEYVSKRANAAVKSDIENQIAVALGGRAAEECLLGHVSDGAMSDLEQATDLIFSMRYKWGLCQNNLLSLSSDKKNDLDPLSPLGAVLNADLKRIYLRSKKLIEENQDLVQLVADALQAQRELSSNDLSSIFGAARPEQGLLRSK
jgi:Cdc6-like AAA superfamily ATPase